MSLENVSVKCRVCPEALGAQGLEAGIPSLVLQKITLEL